MIGVLRWRRDRAKALDANYAKLPSLVSQFFRIPFSILIA